VHVARKQRVETYLNPENIELIETTGMDKSEFIRKAVRQKLATEVGEIDDR